MAVDVSSLQIKVSSDGIQQASSALSGLSTSANNAEKRVSALTQAMNNLEKASKTATSQADIFNSKLTSQVATLAALRADTAASAAATTQLAAALAALSATILRVVTVNNSATVSQRAHNESMQQAHALARGLSGSMGVLWVTYGRFAGMAAGLAIGASLKQVMVQGIELEHTLEAIRVKGNETTESITQIRKVVLDLGQGVYGPQKVAEAFEILTMAGLSAEQSLKAVSSALNLATVGGVGIEKAAETLVSVGTAAGYTAEGYARVADVIAKTAAVSKSSVAGLSTSFTTASSIMQLYKLSIEDVGTSLAALSQLGIERSSAGTALKNFYKDLTSGSDKATLALKQMGLSLNDLRDKDGKMNDVATIFKKMSEGLKDFQGGTQSDILKNVFGERGIKVAAEGIRLVRLEAEDGSNAFTSLGEKINDSYGFAAKGAVALSLTTKNQLTAVANTLSSTFADTFKSVEPEVQVFAYKLKQIFGSGEFKSGVTEATRFLIGFTEKVIEGYGYIIDYLKWLAELYNKIPILGTVLQTVGKIWNWYHEQIAGGDSAAKAAGIYTEGYVNGLIKQAKEIDEVNKKLERGLTLGQAKQEIEKDNAKGELERLNSISLAKAKASFEEAKNNVNNVAGTSLIRTHAAVEHDKLYRAKELTKATNAYIEAQNKAGYAVEFATKVEEAHAEKFRRNAELLKAVETKRNSLNPSGENTIAPKIKGQRGEDNALFMEAQKEFEAAMKASKKELQTFEDSINAQFKAGEIGKLQVIEQTASKSEEMYSQQATLLRKRLAEAEAAPKSLHKEPNVAVLKGQLEAVEKELSNVSTKAREDTNVYLARLDEENNARVVKTLEAQGKFVEAAALKYSAGYSRAYKQVEADYTAAQATLEEGFVNGADALELDAMFVNVDRLAKSVKGLSELKIEMMGLAAAKEDAKALDAQMVNFKNSMADVFASAEASGSLSSALGAASMVEEIQSKVLPELEKLKISRKAAMGDGTNADMVKAYEEVVKQINTVNDASTKAAQTTSNAWKATGESIAESITNAFGEAGKAFGGVITAYTSFTANRIKQDEAYNQSHARLSAKATTGDITSMISLAKLEKDHNKKSEMDEVSMYANMAGAAKGMFKEKSAAYRLFDAFEKGIHIYKLGMQAAEILGIGTVTAARLTALSVEAEAEMIGVGLVTVAETTKQGAYGITALAAALALPFPANIPAFAIVAAMLAAIGVAVGGGGGSGGSVDTSAAKQEKAGTGTVLGDEGAKSDSIAKSIEILSKNSDILNTQSNGMLNALLAIKDNLGGIAALVSQSTGLRATPADERAAGVGSTSGFLGIGATSTTIVDSGIAVTAGQTVGSAATGGLQGTGYTDVNKKDSGIWGLFSSDSTNRQFVELKADLKKQFGMTIAQLRDGVMSAASVLGISGQGLVEKLNAMSIDIGDISFKGLSGEEIESQLEAIFSSVGDQMAKEIVPSIGAFQKVGEGMFQTLVRVASGITEADGVLRQFNITAIDYTAIMNKQGNVAAEITRQSIMAKEGAKFTTSAGYFTQETKKTKTVTQEYQSVATGEGLATMLVDVEKTVDTIVQVWHDGTTQLSGDMTGVGRIMAQLPTSMTAEDMGAVYQQLLTLRAGLELVGFGAIDLDANMIRAAGGIAKLQEGLDVFADKFFTSTEKNRKAYDLMEKQFTASGNAMPKTRTEWRKVLETLEEGAKILPGMSAAQLAVAETAKVLLGSFVAMTPGMEEAYSAVDEFMSRAGVSAADMASLIQDGLMGRINEADLGGALANMVVGGVYNAIANGAADTITGLVMDKLVTPIMTDIMNGASVTATLSKYLTDANIDAMIAGATAAVTAMSAIFNDPKFKKAMDDLKLAMGQVAHAVVSGGPTGYTPYVPPEPVTPGTSGTTTETRKGHALEIELLKLQGMALEALNLQREDELAALSDADKLIKQQIYALQDLQALRNLETGLLTAEGKTYEALLRTRADALRLMVPEQRAIQLLINAAQDKAKTDSLSLEIMKLSGDEAGALAFTRAKELLTLSETDKVLQQHIYLLEDQAKAAAKSIDAMKAIVAQMDALANLQTSLSGSVQAIKQDAEGYDMKGFLAGNVDKYKAELSAVSTGTIEERIKAAENLQTAIVDQYNFEKSEIEKKVAKEEAAYNAGIQAQNKAIDAANRLNDAFRNIGEYAKTMLVGASSPLSLQQKVVESTRQYQELLAKTKGGDLDAAGKLTGASGVNLEAIKSTSKTSLEYNRAFLRQQVELANIGSLAQANIEQITASGFVKSAALQTEMNELQTNAIKELKLLQEKTDFWQQELQTKLAAEAAVFAAINQSAATIALQTENLDGRIGAVIVAALSAAAANVLGTGTLPTEQQAPSGYEPETGGLEGVLTGGLDSFAVGTNYVPEDMLARIHKGERIVPAADNARLEQLLRGKDDNSELVAELREVKALLASMGVSIKNTDMNTSDTVKYVKRTSDVIEQVGRDGSTLQVTTTPA